MTMKPGDVRESAALDEEPLAHALSEHHRGLEQAFDAIVVRSQCGDPAMLRPAWAAFEHELRKHMELEERELLPLFERSHGDEARELQREHDAIRETMFRLGLDLDLHQLRAEVVIDLATRLRAHSTREALGLYPWLERNVPARLWQALSPGLSLGNVVPGGASGPN